MAHRLHRSPYLSSPQEKRRLWSPYCNTFIYLICNIINRWLHGDQGTFKENETASYATCSFESVQGSIKVCDNSCKSWCSESVSFNLCGPFLTYYISKTSKAGLICITELYYNWQAALLTDFLKLIWKLIIKTFAQVSVVAKGPWWGETTFSS